MKQRLKLFTGHYFIYSLRVIEYYLRMITQSPAASGGTNAEAGPCRLAAGTELGKLSVNELADLSVAAELEGREAAGGLRSGAGSNSNPISGGAGGSSNSNGNSGGSAGAHSSNDTGSAGAHSSNSYSSDSATSNSDPYRAEWLRRLKEPLSEHRGASDGSVPPRTSTGCSSVNLGEKMSTRPSTLNNYMKVFAVRYQTIYQSQLAGLPREPGKQRLGNCQPSSGQPAPEPSVKAFIGAAPEPSVKAFIGTGSDSREQLAAQRASERMSALPYRVSDNAITPKLNTLVLYIIDNSGFFDGLPMLYYLFYRWHRIDYSDIRSIKADGVELPYYDDLINVLKLLEERRWGFDSPELIHYLNEYFGYYAQFISNPDVVNALGYSYHTCNKYNNPEVTERLLLDLWSVHRAFHRTKRQGLTDEDRPIKTGGGLPGRQLQIVEQPRIPDRTPFANNPTWAGSFESAFASVVQRRKRTDQAVARFRSLAKQKGGVFKQEQLQDMQLLLETANMLPSNTKLENDNRRFNSNIFSYDAIKEQDFAAFKGLGFTIPYRPLIDSNPQLLLGYADFSFQADFGHRVPRLDAGPFEPLLEQFLRDSRLKAINAGYAGVSEQKIYLYDAQLLKPGGAAADGAAADGSGAAAAAGNTAALGASAAKSNGAAAGCTAHTPHYLFKAGLTDYFTGIARKDLFSRFLVPSLGNLRQPLTYLLERGCLDAFILDDSARELQQSYLSADLSELPSAVRLTQLLPAGSTQEQELMWLLRYEINRLYTKTVANSARLDQQGCPVFIDNGATYTGCGCFVLTADRDSAGRDRPFLLLERRWKVSEENDNLSYPSGGSCDFFTPDDKVPNDRPDIKDLEADPFKTAVRELREELNILIAPEELKLISFGIDVNRNLQQFSFLYESPHGAQRILERKQYASTPREGLTFAVPFHAQALLDLLNNYQMESGAVYSIMRLMELRRERLW